MLTDRWRHGKRTQESAWRGSHGQIHDNLDVKIVSVMDYNGLYNKKSMCIDTETKGVGGKGEKLFQRESTNVEK